MSLPFSFLSKTSSSLRIKRCVLSLMIGWQLIRAHNLWMWTYWCGLLQMIYINSEVRTTRSHWDRCMQKDRLNPTLTQMGGVDGSWGEGKQPRWMGPMRNTSQHMSVNCVFARQAGELDGPAWPHGHTKSYRFLQSPLFPQLLPTYLSALSSDTFLCQHPHLSISAKGLFWALMDVCSHHSLRGLCGSKL